MAPVATVPLPSVPVKTVSVLAPGEMPDDTSAPLSLIRIGLKIRLATMSAAEFANGLPSMRTNPRAVPSRLIAFTLPVESQATYVPGRPPAAARAAQMASAPARPPRSPL